MWSYNYNTNYGNELYHHGILGQKWGKKNGLPYPLDAEAKKAYRKIDTIVYLSMQPLLQYNMCVSMTIIVSLKS